MPDRILRDWTDSANLEGLSPEAECLFVRLIMKVDDFGRFHGDSRLVKSACFPLIERLRTNEVDRWLDELSTRQLVLCYEVNGRKLISIVNFGQRLRSVRARFPAMDGKPENWLATCSDLPQSAASCGNPPQSAASCGNPPQVAARREGKGNEVETEVETEVEEKKKRGDVCTLPQALEFARTCIMPPINPECAQGWHDHMLSIGWQINNMPVQDWKAALRRWASKWNTNNQSNRHNFKTTTPHKGIPEKIEVKRL